jgi:hypothetical protein
VLERHVERRARSLDAVLQGSGDRDTGTGVRDDATTREADVLGATAEPMMAPSLAIITAGSGVLPYRSWLTNIRGTIV